MNNTKEENNGPKGFGRCCWRELSYNTHERFVWRHNKEWKDKMKK